MDSKVNAQMPARPPSASKDKVIVRGLNFYYGENAGAKDVTLNLFEGQVHGVHRSRRAAASRRCCAC